MQRNAHVYRFRDSVALSLTGQGGETVYLAPADAARLSACLARVAVSVAAVPFAESPAGEGGSVPWATSGEIPALTRDPHAGATNADGTRRPSLAADLAALTREGVPNPFHEAAAAAIAALTRPHYGDADTRADNAADAAEILARALSL